MEAQLGKLPILSITAKLHLQIVYASYYRQGWYYTLFTKNYWKEDMNPLIYQLLLKGCYYTLFTNNYWKEDMTPWFYHLLLKGCYYTLFTSNYWKEATTPLQDCILPLHHPSTLTCSCQYYISLFPSISVINWFYTSLVSASSSFCYHLYYRDVFFHSAVCL